MTRALTDFMATLHRNGTEEKKLSKYVTHRISDDFVTLSVAFPEDGQYGMDIYTREVNGSNNTGDRITISFPVPTTTPPLSASHHSKEVAHVQQLHHHHTHHSSNSLGGESLEAKQQCSFTDEQVDCICDNLQQRMDVEMLGKFLLLAVGAFVTSYITFGTIYTVPE